MDAHDLLNNLTGGQGFTGLGLNIPPIAPVPASVSFDIEWSGVITSGKVVNEMQTFRGNYVRTGATIDWSASSQGGFTFVSEPPNPSATDIRSLVTNRTGFSSTRIVTTEKTAFGFNSNGLSTGRPFCFGSFSRCADGAAHACNLRNDAPR